MAIRIPIFTKYNDAGIRKAQKDFGLLGGSLNKLGKAVAGAFAVGSIAAFGKAAISAAEGAQVANARLENIASSMGIFGEQAGVVTDRLKAFAEQQMMIVGQDDELIKSTQAKLLTFKDLAATAGEAGGALDRATIAAFDLAAAGFGSAESNATQLGKALQDPIKGLASLRKAGVTFTEAERERIKTLVESNQIGEAQNLILSAIETQVGGTAEATVTASQKMKLAFGELQEDIGEALLPAFEQLTAILMPLIEELGPILSKIFEALAPIVLTLAEAISPLLDALSPLFDALILIIEAITPIIEQLMPVFIEVVEMLAPIVLQLVEAFLPLIQKILPPFLELLESLIPILQILADFLSTAVIPVLGVLGDIVSNVLIGAVNLLTGAFQGLKSILEPVWNFLKPIIEGLLALAGIKPNQLKKDVTISTKAEDNRFARLNPATSPALKNIKVPSLDTGGTGGKGGKGGKSAKAEFMAAREKVQGYIKDTQKEIAKAMDGYNKAVAKANEDYAAEVEKANERFLKVEGELTTRRNEELKKSLEQHNKDRLDILADYAARAKDIIQQSMARLKDAFRSATAFTISDFFSTETVSKIVTKVEQITDRIQISTSNAVTETVTASAGTMIKGLTDKLNASKALIENASKLAAAGFSQTFIEQVISSGTETGNQLAQSILEATPESQSELQKVFSELEATTETGVDQLAQSIYDRHGLATRELKQLYADNQSALTAALIEEQTAYDAAVAEINASFQTSLAEAVTERDTAIADANAALKQALKDSALALSEDLADIESKFTEKIESMKGKLGGLSGTIAQVRGKIDTLQSQAATAAETSSEIIRSTPTLASTKAAAPTTTKTPTTAPTNIVVNVQANDRVSGAKAGEAAVSAISKYVAKNGSAVGFITGGRAIV